MFDERDVQTMRLYFSCNKVYNPERLQRVPPKGFSLGSVDREVASDTSDPLLKSGSHQQI